MLSSKLSSLYLVGTFTVLLLLAGAADAQGGAPPRTFRMSGVWQQERGALRVPFGGANAVQGAVASAIGSAPATLTIPANRFVGTGSVVVPLPASGQVQLSTMFSAVGPTAPGNMRAGAKASRPANFAFCPGAAANPFCGTPNQGTQHGLVVYAAGLNQFGGTMQMLVAVRVGSNSDSDKHHRDFRCWRKSGRQTEFT